MAYQALYRKWRPLVFSDVSSQEHVTESLKQQVASNHLSHAYLFTGTRGTGKTTCAKILSRAVNCENPRNGDPCNECPSCKGILSGGIMDVLEIDAASNNGVDNIRDIREEVVYSPASVKKRVYIIDEVHMLSTGAFNALLKTLEEPPEHVLFILATTEVQKVPATILSRCQRFDFVRVRPSDIAGRLLKIADGEGLTLPEDVAMKIARYADGSMRDAISIFDRCISGSSSLTMQRLSSILGFADNETVLKLLNSISVSDLPSALSSLSDFYAAGMNLSSLFEELLLFIRDLMIIKLAPQKSAHLLSPSHELSELEPLAARFTTPRLIFISDTITEAQARMQRGRSRITDAEMCLIKICAEPANDSAPFAFKMPEAVPVLKPAPPPREEPTQAASPKEPAPSPRPVSKKPSGGQAPAASAPNWGLLISKLAGKVPPSVFAHLNLADALFEDNAIRILVEPEAIDHLSTVKVKSAIASAAKDLFSRDFSVEVSAQDGGAPANDPCLELIQNARLGGVDLEIK